MLLLMLIVGNKIIKQVKSNSKANESLKAKRREAFFFDRINLSTLISILIALDYDYLSVNDQMLFLSFRDRTETIKHYEIP